jgi:hypothetical protein
VSYYFKVSSLDYLQELNISFGTVISVMYLLEFSLTQHYVYVYVFKFRINKDLGLILFLLVFVFLSMAFEFVCGDTCSSCGPPLWSSGQSSWLQIQGFGFRLPVLPDFLKSSGSGMGSTKPCEYN